MKKLKMLPFIAAMPLFMGSCVIYSEHVTTGNPIGTKTGYVRSHKGSFDAGFSAAAKDGKITKIGSYDYKMYSNGMFSLTVTGE
jgi:hypothetical protein